MAVDSRRTLVRFTCNSGHRALGLRINIVHLGADDQAVHHSSAVAGAIGATEQPGLPGQRDAAHRSFGCIVRQANAAPIGLVDRPIYFTGRGALQRYRTGRLYALRPRWILVAALIRCDADYRDNHPASLDHTLRLASVVAL